MSCGPGLRHSSDPALLWLWCRPAAVALIRPLAWEPPYAPCVALKKQKEDEKKKTKDKLSVIKVTWWCNIQFGVQFLICNQYLKAAERVNLKSSHHKKKIFYLSDD